MFVLVVFQGLLKIYSTEAKKELIIVLLIFLILFLIQRLSIKSYYLNSRMLGLHSINNIINSALAIPESDQKDKYFMTLGSLLKYSYENQKEMYVHLEKELEICYQLIDIYNISYEKKIGLNCMKDNLCKNVIVLPFVLVTVVENALKHGFRGKDEGVIYIQVEKMEKVGFLFSFWGFQLPPLRNLKTPLKGHGLYFMTERLHFLHYFKSGKIKRNSRIRIEGEKLKIIIPYENTNS